MLSSFLFSRTRTCPGVQVCCLPHSADVTISPPNPQPTPDTTPPVTIPDLEPTPDQGGLQIPSVTPGTGCGRRRFPANLDTGLKVTGGERNVPRK